MANDVAIIEPMRTLLIAAFAISSFPTMAEPLGSELHPEGNGVTFFDEACARDEGEGCEVASISCVEGSFTVEVADFDNAALAAWLTRDDTAQGVLLLDQAKMSLVPTTIRSNELNGTWDIESYVYEPSFSGVATAKTLQAQVAGRDLVIDLSDQNREHLRQVADHCTDN